MTIDPELRQMLRDAGHARAKRTWIVRAWHAAAERIDIFTAARRSRAPKPKGPIMFFDDLRHAARRIKSKPATAMACIGMLALAIGVTSAMFTVADHMLLRPAPFRDPSTLRQVYVGTELKNSRVYVPAPIAKALRQSSAFAGVAYFSPDPSYIDGLEGLASVGSYRVSPGAFEMFGVKPLMGRTFAAGEGRPGNDDSLIISERVWRSLFGAATGIVGTRVSVNGTPLTVIGVMPDEVRFPSDSTKIWRPFDIDLPSVSPQAPLMVYTRLTRGTDTAAAASIGADATRAWAAAPEKHGLVLRELGAGLLDNYSKTAIRVLLGGVGLVFLVLCANATNLILARTTARRQEFGVCSALGASRLRLIRQVISENALISAAALVVGLVMAWGLVSMARAFLPDAFLIRTLNPLSLDARAFGAATTLAVIATLVAGLPPAWIGTKLDAAGSIRLESRGASESKLSRAWTRSLLVGEVALASALLVGAGVLLTTFVKLTRLDSGMNIKNVSTMYVTLPAFAFKDRPARATFSESLLRELRSLPGVNAVTLSFGLPPSGGGFGWGRLVADGVLKTTNPEQFVFDTSVTPDFFDVYGIRLIEGRTFAPSDPDDAVLIGESLAGMLWPGQSPIGHTFRFDDDKDSKTVIGLVKEVRSILQDPREDVPEYYRQLKAPGSSQVMLGIRCESRCPGEPLLRERVRAVNSQAVLYRLQTLESAYLEQFSRPRAAAGLAVAFAVTSVLAAAAGLFSILTYAVSRRRREFGIRSAMGAAPAQLRRLILGDGLIIALVGLGIGAVLTVLANTTLKSLSFGVTAAHPLVWASVAVVVCAVTLLAAWRPAANAMKSDPISLLRDN